MNSIMKIKYLILGCHINSELPFMSALTMVSIILPNETHVKKDIRKIFV